MTQRIWEQPGSNPCSRAVLLLKLLAEAELCAVQDLLVAQGRNNRDRFASKPARRLYHVDFCKIETPRKGRRQFECDGGH